MPFLIGRQGENNLVLRDNRISRSHARISADEGEYVVEDLDSRHGVFVNGQRVKRQQTEGRRSHRFWVPGFLPAGVHSARKTS